MERRRRIKWVVLGALLLVVPFIYEFNVHPLFGFLAALLVSWLIAEDFYDKLIDLRISGALLLVVLTWNQLKDWAHFFHAVATFVGFAVCFYILRLVFARFIPLAEYIEERGDNKEDTPIAYLDTLQEGAKVGLMPLMGLATYLVLTADMIFNPVQLIFDWTREGSGLAGAIWQIHCTMLQFGILVDAYKDVFIGVLCLLSITLGILVWLTHWKIAKRKQLPLYPCGAGDPLVIGIFAAMVGAECFYMSVMMLTLLFGIMAHGYNSYKGRRI